MAPGFFSFMCLATSLFPSVVVSHAAMLAGPHSSDEPRPASTRPSGGVGLKREIIVVVAGRFEIHRGIPCL